MKYEYKYSGIEWIGEVPKHWKIERLKDVSSIIETGSTPTTAVYEYFENGTIPWYGPSSFNGTTYLSEPVKMINKIALEAGELKIFDKDSLLIIGIGATIGKMALLSEPSSCNQQINIFTPDKHIHSKYLLYFMSRYEDIIIQIAQFTTLPIFNQTRYGILNIAVPPIKEQTTIIDYLDKACTELDRVLEIKRLQLEQSKFMFFSFLEEIFESNGSHWEEERIKDISTVNPSRTEILLPTSFVSVVPMDTVSEFGDIEAPNICEYQDIIGGLNYFRNGDVIFAKITPCMENGKGAYVEGLETEVAFGSTEFFVMRPSQKLIGKYIYYFTRTLKFRQEAEANMKGAAGGVN